MNLLYLRCFLTAIAVLSFASVAKAQDMPVFYDYVENGVLQGGRITVDRGNPDHRRVFGLDPLGRVAGPVWSVTTVLDNGPITNRIDIVMLGDGYTTGETTTYAAHVDAILASFFAGEPFAAYSTYFNVHRVDVVSNESGVDEIDLGIFKDTALDMEYGCFGIARLLCINISKTYDAAASAPAVDQILALANSTRYGGAGYPFDNLGTVAGNNSSAVEIGLHEFGHSFADLADEYDYADGTTYIDPEPSEPNVSIFNAPTQIAQSRKWYRWMNLPSVDTFEGAYYTQFGIYRPTSNSKMRSLNRPFEEINIEQFVISIYEIVSPIDDATPSSPVPLPHTTEFFVTPLQPIDHNLDVQWFIDGVEVIGAVSSTFIPSDVCPALGLHDVAVTVIDNTARVRDPNARALWMTDTRQWQIDVSEECEIQPANAIVWDPTLNPTPWPNANPLATTRSLRFTVTGLAGPAKPEAIKVTMVDLQHPKPANLTAQAPSNFTTYDTRLNGVCNGGTLNGHHCDADADCPPLPVVVGRCSSMVTCTAAGEANGCARWVGKPGTFLESQDLGVGGGIYIAARLQCTPFYYDWTTEGLIAVVGAEIVPSSEYSVQTYGASCMGAEDGCTNVSTAVTMYTRRAGDAAPGFNPPLSATQPDALDVAAVVTKLKSLPGALVKAITQLQPNVPELNANVNALDIAAVVDGVKRVKYAFSGPCTCPSAVTCGESCTDCAGMCVKTCSGGTNDGQPCIDSTRHCPGGTCGTPLCRDRCGRCRP
jgi:hypothetical protein